MECIEINITLCFISKLNPFFIHIDTFYLYKVYIRCLQTIIYHKNSIFTYLESIPTIFVG